MVWVWRYLEYSEQKDHSMQWIRHRGVCRTAPATPGLLNILNDVRTYCCLLHVGSLSRVQRSATPAVPRLVPRFVTLDKKNNSAHCFALLSNEFVKHNSSLSWPPMIMETLFTGLHLGRHLQAQKKYLKLIKKGTACYAGLFLAPAEGFGL